jgi:glyoxylase-like metal-dependent hydrolase (beta-lactamase superfamily II)
MYMKIAEKWYDRQRISDDITLLREPHVHPLLRCNIWHIRGRDKDLLIDTGLGVASLRTEIKDLIDKPLTALATHIHYDHVGCLHEFDTRLMHPIEAPLMEDYQEYCSIVADDLPQEFQDDLSRQGTPIVGDALIGALPCADFNISKFKTKSVKPTQLVEEGDIIDLGDRHFEVLHLPGHSGGCIGLWEKRSGTLFSGDAIYDGHLLDELEESDISAYVTTMKRLRDLPVTIVHGGHEESFGRERLIEIADDYILRRS